MHPIIDLLQSIIKLILINASKCWNQSTDMLSQIKKVRMSPTFFCRKFYYLGPCTLEADIHYLELVQSALCGMLALF